MGPLKVSKDRDDIMKTSFLPKTLTNQKAVFTEKLKSGSVFGPSTIRLWVFFSHCYWVHSILGSLYYLHKVQRNNENIVTGSIKVYYILYVLAIVWIRAQAIFQSNLIKKSLVWDGNYCWKPNLNIELFLCSVILF